LNRPRASRNCVAALWPLLPSPLHPSMRPLLPSPLHPSIRPLLPSPLHPSMRPLLPAPPLDPAMAPRLPPAPLTCEAPLRPLRPLAMAKKNRRSHRGDVGNGGEVGNRCGQRGGRGTVRGCRCYLCIHDGPAHLDTQLSARLQQVCSGRLLHPLVPHRRTRRARPCLKVKACAPSRTPNY
jgi:hypothetical protein